MVLVDTSVWIDCFRGGGSVQKINSLIENDEVCVNGVVLSELLPSMRLRRENEICELLLALPKIPLRINWERLTFFQTQNLFHGINKVGLPDLMILQNALEFNVPLFTLDKHFALMSDLFGLKLF